MEVNLVSLGIAVQVAVESPTPEMVLNVGPVEQNKGLVEQTCPSSIAYNTKLNVV